MTIADILGRPLRSLRISVTDRCNLRCQYCMPEDDYVWLPRTSLLSFEEIVRLARIAVTLGVTKIRLTGGEPLLRRDLDQLVNRLSGIEGLAELALTTNGLLLAPAARTLRDAGLGRITVSLDTLRPERMAAFARSARHGDVIAGIDAALGAGFSAVKLNTVVVRGFNDDELVAIVRFAHQRGLEPRFIEYMDVGGATRWDRAAVVSRDEMLATLGKEFGPVQPLEAAARGAAPAERFRLPDGGVVGIIASTTAPFCRDCDRARLTADGTLFLCLYAARGHDLREALRRGAADAEVAELIRTAWHARADRGAEQRARMADRGVLVPLSRLRADPRQEMHVRGG